MPQPTQATEDRTNGSKVPSGNWCTYFIQGQAGGNIKIGRAHDAQKRLKDLQIGSPDKLVLLLVLDGDRESDLHGKFKSDRRHGEWFDPSNEIAAFIENNGGRSIALSIPTRFDVELLKHAAVLHCGGKWVLIEELDELLESWGSGSDECSLFTEPTVDCECEGCCVDRAVNLLDETGVVGCVWRRDDAMLCAVVPDPSSIETQASVLMRLLDSYDEFDAAGISLNLIFIDQAGTVLDGDLFGAHYESLRLQASRRLGRRSEASNG